MHNLINASQSRRHKATQETAQALPRYDLIPPLIKRARKRFAARRGSSLLCHVRGDVPDGIHLPGKNDVISRYWTSLSGGDVSALLVLLRRGGTTSETTSRRAGSGQGEEIRLLNRIDAKSDRRAPVRPLLGSPIQHVAAADVGGLSGVQ